ALDSPCPECGCSARESLASLHCASPGRLRSLRTGSKLISWGTAVLPLLAGSAVLMSITDIDPRDQTPVVILAALIVLAGPVLAAAGCFAWAGGSGGQRPDAPPNVVPPVRVVRVLTVAYSVGASLSIMVLCVNALSHRGSLFFDGWS